MDFERNWETALKTTEIVRARIKPLSTYGTTQLPYVFLCEALSDPKSTLVRKGKIEVEKPSLLLPSNTPQFEGFELGEKLKADVDSLMNFMLVRGVRFPSMKFSNVSDDISLHDGRLSEAIRYHQDLLQKEENLSAGLVVGKESCWQFSILIFAGSQMIKSADGDIKRLLEDYRRKQ